MGELFDPSAPPTAASWLKFKKKKTAKKQSKDDGPSDNDWDQLVSVDGPDLLDPVHFLVDRRKEVVLSAEGPLSGQVGKSTAKLRKLLSHRRWSARVLWDSRSRAGARGRVGLAR